MMRVIYRWHVAPENLAAFSKAWSEATNHIHATVPGASGSFMLQACDSESEVLTVARWHSLEYWESFWDNNNPQQMQAMRKLARRVSTDVYYEVEDFTR